MIERKNCGKNGDSPHCSDILLLPSSSLHFSILFRLFESVLFASIFRQCILLFDKVIAIANWVVLLTGYLWLWFQIELITNEISFKSFKIFLKSFSIWWLILIHKRGSKSRPFNHSAHIISSSKFRSTTN